MSNTLSALSAEFGLNRGNHVRTSNDVHFMVRRLIEDMMTRMHAAGTDMAKLYRLLDDLGSNAIDIAAGISGVAANSENTPQPENVRRALDGTVLNADGTPRGGAPGRPYGDTRNADGSAHIPNEPMRTNNPATPSGEPARNPDGSLVNPTDPNRNDPARHPDGTVRADIPAHVPNKPRDRQGRDAAKV